MHLAVHFIGYCYMRNVYSVAWFGHKADNIAAVNLRDNLGLAQTLLRDEIVGRLFVQVLFNSLNLKELR